MNEQEQQAYNEALEKILETSKKQFDVLDISNITGLIKLPSEIDQIKSLKELYYFGNKLAELPSSIGNLSQLQVLYLESNALEQLPSELFNLRYLRRLYLFKNKLSEVPVGIEKMKCLERLDLRWNNIRRLPKTIIDVNIDIKWHDGIVDGINLFGNPIQTPPLEIVKQGRDAIKNYFESMTGAEIQLFEAKLLVVGPGGAGKTYLSNRLVTGVVPETKTTEGIDILKWIVDTNSIKNFRLNLWDFGGQEIYHATHQFFLTKRSLYLFVWEARKDDDRVSFSYWLNVIRLLSDNAPVIMVMNKCDERIKEINQASIQKQFPNVIDFYKVSASENVRISDLRNRIIDEVEKLEHIGTTLPKQWVDIRSQLEEMKESGTNYLTYEEYEEVCSRYGLGKEQAKYLAEYYHQLGVILYFSDNPVLENVVFLNPEWATDAVYRITDYRPIVNNCGRFHFDQLKNVWKDYPDDKYVVLLALMVKFELCFNLDGTEEYIVPELLAAEKSQLEWNYKNNLRFQYEYEFMPAGIVTRFMVRRHELIKSDLYWKNGVVMEWEGTRSLIECNEFDGRIDIKIEGEDTKGMLAIIRSEIHCIHETLNCPQVTEKMSCVCSECRINSNNPFFYKFHELRVLRNKQVSSVRCMISAEKISIDELFAVYIVKKASKEEMQESMIERGISITDSSVVIDNGLSIGRLDQMTQERIINIGDGNVINAPVLIADQIENSFNTVAESKLDEEVKSLLKQLIQEVNEASKDVPKEKAELMARDVEALSKEVTSSKPRRRWYEISIEGLKETAEAVGKVGEPILKMTRKLLPLLKSLFG